MLEHYKVLFFIVLLGVGTLWHLQEFLQHNKYTILELTPFTILLYHPIPPFLEQFQQVSFFHLYTCIHSICIIFMHLPPSPPTGTNPSWQGLFHPPVLQFCKRKI
jgi:hypothetical protein